MVAAAAGVTAVLAFGQISSAAGPVENNPVVDGARQALAGFLAAHSPIDDSDLDLADCPILGEEAFVSPLAFFGPAEPFDSYAGELSVDTDDPNPFGLTCEAERSVAPTGGVLSGGVAVWDFSGHADVLTQITGMQFTSDDLGDHDLLGGDMYGYCEEDSDVYECYQFWTSDGFVLAMFVGFESVDSQKDPLTAVGQVLADQLPGLLANVSALTPVPGLSTPDATVATTTVPIVGK